MESNVSGTSPRRWPAWGCSDQAKPGDLRNALLWNFWLAVWMAVFVLSAWLLRRFGGDNPWLAATALGTTALAAIPAIRATLRFLREADELTRLIQIQAMAIAFGGGVIAFTLERFVQQLIELAALPEIMLDLTSPLMVMCLTYAVTVLLLQRRYAG